MKPSRFLLLVCGVIAALGAAYVAAFSLAVRQPVWPYHWLRNVYLAKEQLATDSRAPRCLILGGSSAWFGFQSQVIEQATGRQVINLGMHAEMPLEFQLWQAERHLQRGDLVLLADELAYYWPRARYTTFAATEIALMAPQFWWRAPLGTKYDLLAAVPPMRIVTGLTAWIARDSAGYRQSLALPSTAKLMENLRDQWSGRFPEKIPAYYNYLELDGHGDNTRPRQPSSHPHEDYGLMATHLESPETWATLADFARRMKARGVRCLVTWPPFERHEGFDLQASQVQANFDFLRRRLSAAGWQVVGEPEDATMTTGFFYDTPYHLTTEAARLRTERLVERMRTAGLIEPAAGAR